MGAQMCKSDDTYTSVSKKQKGSIMTKSMKKRRPANKGIIAEYIWIDGAGDLRSKARTLSKKVTNVNQLPEWNYDGSSCFQATTENSEIIMQPVFFFPDPFRGGDHIMVLTETFMWKDKTYKELIPSNTNFRHFAKKIFDAGLEEEPWFGLE